MHLLVDGYNVLFQSGLLGQGRGPGFLERGRAALLGVIAASLDADQRSHTTIVFDARDRLAGTTAEQDYRGMTVLFALEYEDADALLEELIRKAPQPKLLTVVSSDHRIQAAARRRRAKAVDAERWFHSLRSLESRPSSSPATKEKPDAPPTDQLDDWCDYFGVERAEPSDPSNDDPFPPGYADPL